ncbi:MAG TPA: tolB protein [Polyangiaceae bacterium]|nr:tolB protein [Polyangiaceae bacterium]
MNQAKRSTTLRASTLCRGLALAALALVASVAAPERHALADDAAKPTQGGDPLANFVVTPEQATRPLPKIAVLPSLAPDMEDVTLRSVVRRDLELSGEFDVIPDSAAPEGVYMVDTPIDVKAWQAKGVEALVRVVGRKVSADKAELRAQAFLLNVGADPAFDKRWEIPLDRVRSESHFVADQLIGALTGSQGGFFSHLTFVAGTGVNHRVYRIDSDGFDAKPISPPDHVAIAPAYGPDGELFWSASVNKDEYKIFKASDPTHPLKLNVKGSVYGLAFNKDFTQVAAGIATGSSIKAYVGPSFDQLKEAAPIDMALRPGFTPTGKLAFAGAGKFGQRVFVDGKPISPDGLFASSPTFCRHPDGIRAVFAVGVGKATDLVATGETGGQLVRLTQGAGSNSYPACSPDGRLVAFFSTRTSGEGPGLYVMRLDGGRPKRVSSLMGDSLRWDRLPPTKAVEKK